jgi:hypothetical protein
VAEGPRPRGSGGLRSQPAPVPVSRRLPAGRAVRARL